MYVYRFLESERNYTHNDKLSIRGIRLAENSSLEKQQGSDYLQRDNRLSKI